MEKNNLKYTTVNKKKQTNCGVLPFRLILVVVVVVVCGVCISS
jgi:t-SNARE complex subunit (syntaxin)